MNGSRNKTPNTTKRGVGLFMLAIMIVGIVVCEYGSLIIGITILLASSLVVGLLLPSFLDDD